MIGRELSQLYPKRQLPIGQTLLEVRSLCCGTRLHDISFSLHKGEILGVAGILGSGIAELAMCLFGVDRQTSGEILIKGKPMPISSPVEAKKNGIALIPDDRRTEGLVSGMTIRENLSLAFVTSVSRRGVLRRRMEKQRSDQVVDALKIKATGIEQVVDSLSGGNQQKVVIGRWLIGNSEVFILNQPTTGVDVGSKVEIYNAMLALAEKGAGIIMISQDFEELLGMSDRILVVSGGRVTKSFAYGQATEQDLLQYATSI